MDVLAHIEFGGCRCVVATCMGTDGKGSIFYTFLCKCLDCLQHGRFGGTKSYGYYLFQNLVLIHFASIFCSLLVQLSLYNRYTIYLCVKTIDLVFVQNPKEHEICSKRTYGTPVPLVKYEKKKRGTNKTKALQKHQFKARRRCTRKC